MPTIQTSRLLLRPAQLSDLEAMHSILSNKQAMKYWSSLPHTDTQQTHDWLQSMIDANPAGSLDYIVDLDGVAIGKAGCWRIPEIGFILHPDYWGQGFASEALKAIIPSVFESYSIPELKADVDPRNLGSLAVLKKLGFQETGRVEKNFQLGDEWCDSVYLSLSRERAICSD